MSEEAINQISWVSVIVIVCIAIFCGVYVFFCKSNNELKTSQRKIEQIPSMLSTLGVLGTFIGITIGLWYFDPNNLEKSVPFLLGGLKTAFFTSLAGMITSLIFTRWINGIYDEYMDEQPTNLDEAVANICAAIDKNARTQTTYNNQTLALFQNIGKSITQLAVQQQTLAQSAATQNASLSNIEMSHKSLLSNAGEMLETATQQANIMQESLENGKKFDMVMRGYIDEIENEMRNTNNLLALKFDEFATLLRESNTKSLVEVMKNVTAEFQKQMSELINKLVQENFKELNNSVQKLNEWQQENKELVDSLIKQYHNMETEFEGTSDVLTKVSERAQQLVGDGGKLSQLVTALNEVMINDEKFIEISKHLEETVELTKDNMASFDNSTHKLNEWVNGVSVFTDDVQKLIEKLDELNKIRDYGEEFWKQTRKQMDSGIKILQKGNQNVLDQMENSVNTLHAGSQELSSQLQDLDERFYTRLSTTLSELDNLISSMATKYIKRF